MKALVSEYCCAAGHARAETRSAQKRQSACTDDLAAAYDALRLVRATPAPHAEQIWDVDGDLRHGRGVQKRRDRLQRTLAPHDGGHGRRRACAWRQGTHASVASPRDHG